ncbi:azurin [Pelagicoccus sp. SDUM812003]|uniref:azurin n=1 Tax=Pelagicoccus sp. SDUM812003 TaxID=3041267 RepID=UPI00280FFC73|nr:azurin [Pelagicoccus sp. SDUM812003]MDQ8201800.1 azurin [Pelagicoccus sp. SDUM812003]
MKYFNRLLTLLCILASTTFAYAAKEVTVNADDTMRFDVSQIEASAGEPLTIVLHNVGKLPKAAMGHNLVILKPGTDVAAFGNAAVGAAGNEYIPQEAPHASSVLAHTKLLGPGETDTVTYTFDSPGEYPFICSFPGHWALMKGTIVVK